MFADPVGQLPGMHIALDADDGEGPVEGTLPSGALRWALANPCAGVVPTLELPPEENLKDWQAKGVGWGLVVSDKRKLPRPVLDLVKLRKAPVFHYIPAWSLSYRCLRSVKARRNVDLISAPRGVEPDRCRTIS